MFGTGQKFKVARVAGIPIYVSYSWFAIAALFAFATYASFTTTSYADEAAVLTAVTLILFFGSVLLHEGAHAVAARIVSCISRSIVSGRFIQRVLPAGTNPLREYCSCHPLCHGRFRARRARPRLFFRLP